MNLVAAMNLYTPTWGQFMGSIAKFTLILSLMFIASCATNKTSTRDDVPPKFPKTDKAEIKIVEPPPPITHEEKKDLGTYIREGSELLGKGNENAARTLLERGLSYYPNNQFLILLHEQIDADPEVYLGKEFEYYTVKSDEKLAEIAKEKLGDKLLFFILARYNNIEKPDVIGAKEKIKIPTNFQQKAVASPEKAEPILPPAPPPPVQRPEPTADQQPPQIALTQPAALHNAKVMQTTKEYLNLSGSVTADSDVQMFLINDQPVDLDPQGDFSHRIELAPGLTSLELMAIDTHNHKTQTTYTITRNMVPHVEFGKYHALIIGNNDYQHFPQLKAAVSDAKAIKTLLEEHYDFKVELLLNATRQDLMGSLYALRGSLTEADNLLIYYAGHGVQDEPSEKGFWLAVDAQENNPANWISNNDITTVLQSMAPKHVMVVSDSCFSGTLTRAIQPRLPKIPEKRYTYLTKMLKKRSRTALTSGGLEPVPDREHNSKHSVFAREFITALQENMNILEGQKLFEKIRPTVIKEADHTPEYADIRSTGHQGGDFFFVRRK